jgi:hypothetical protein
MKDILKSKNNVLILCLRYNLAECVLSEYRFCNRHSIQPWNYLWDQIANNGRPILITMRLIHYQPYRFFFIGVFWVIHRLLYGILLRARDYIQIIKNWENRSIKSSTANSFFISYSHLRNLFNFSCSSISSTGVTLRRRMFAPWHILLFPFHRHIIIIINF